MKFGNSEKNIKKLLWNNSALEYVVGFLHDLESRFEGIAQSMSGAQTLTVILRQSADPEMDFVAL